jgi:hypothetical protein
MRSHALQQECKSWTMARLHEMQLKEKTYQDHFIRVTIDCLNNLDESLNLAAAKAPLYYTDLFAISGCGIWRDMAGYGGYSEIQ